MLLCNWHMHVKMHALETWAKLLWEKSSPFSGLGVQAGARGSRYFSHACVKYPWVRGLVSFPGAPGQPRLTCKLRAPAHMAGENT